jgi:septum formation protein
MTTEPPALPAPSWPWLWPAPLILASGSSARAGLLRAAGLPLEIMRPDLDERALEAPLWAAGLGAADRALALARTKALAVAASHPGRLVLGADQTLDAPGHSGAKAATRAEARAQLAALSGRVHVLHSAAAIARDGTILFAAVATARLTLRAFDGDFLDAWLDRVGDDALESVGGYRIEGLGAHLVARIEGEHSVILGLPLTQLLAGLRGLGALA